MICWRLCKRKWAKTAFSGLGAAEFPGRWNSPGIRAIYCADSLALAALEILVHVEDKSYLASTRFIAFEVHLPDESIYTPRQLPAGWDRTPPPPSTGRFGSKCLLKKTAPALRFPSAVIAGGSIYVLEPSHPEFTGVRWQDPIPFRFDRRLGAGAQ